MGRILLVRHAQASFLEADYDKLSALGEEQARRLGRYWAKRNCSFDRIFSGPRVRQKRTAEIVSEAFRDAGRELPALRVSEEFDEYPGDTILRRSLPQLLESDGKIREWHDRYRRSSDLSERLKYFERIFEAVTRKWVGGELPFEGVESWAGFCARVNRGISEILAGPTRGQQLAVFCSGGPIGVAMQRALNLLAEDTLRTVWMCRNSSYTEFLFSPNRFTLSAFNAFPHLDEARLLTYR